MTNMDKLIKVSKEYQKEQNSCSIADKRYWQLLNKKRLLRYQNLYQYWRLQDEQKQEQQDQLKQEAAKYVEEIKESIKQSDLMKECKKNITCKDCQHSYLRTSKNTTGDVLLCFRVC